MLDDNDANEIGDDGTSDAEGDRCKYVISFKDGMNDDDIAEDKRKPVAN